MARLNDPPPPAGESVEALKRRFVRQNRELAKNNSAQSLRIRALELEQSRLLSENLGFRARIFSLESELESVRRQSLPGDVKSELVRRVNELSSFIADLSVGSDRKSRHQTRVSSRQDSLRPPGFEDADRDLRLPTISEDKYFPRRTLETEELRAMLVNQANDSPDLGPPPVAHFQDECDPIKFETQVSESIEYEAEVQSNYNDDAEDEMPAAIAVNLETRRKRRSGQGRTESRRFSGIMTSSPEEQRDNSPGLGTAANEPSRTSTKRKLSTRDEEDAVSSNPEPQRKTDNLSLSRQTTSIDSQGLRRGDAHQEQRDEESQESPGKRSKIVLDRKVLANKSTNKDPSSPKKAASVSLKPNQSSRPRTTIARNSSREPKLTITRPQQPTSARPPPSGDLHTPGEEIGQTLPPKTPGASLDLFSPPLSSAPSTVRPESKDTPPPTSANPEVGPTGRAGRRARSQVNYAEPSLISKMRRPTKDLVDAVVPRQERSSLSSSFGQTQPDSAVKDAAGERGEALPMRRPGSIGIEDQPDEEAGTNEPGSPLSKKASSSSLAGSKDTTSSQGEAHGKIQSGSSVAISALIGSRVERASSSSRTSNPPRRAAKDREIDHAKLSRSSQANSLGTTKDSKRPPTKPKEEDPLSVFDFTDTSPPNTANTGAETTRKSAARARADRRHSSAMQLKEGIAKARERGERQRSGLSTSSTTNGDAAGAGASEGRRRRSMMV